MNLRSHILTLLFQAALLTALLLPAAADNLPPLPRPHACLPGSMGTRAFRGSLRAAFGPDPGRGFAHGP